MAPFGTIRHLRDLCDPFAFAVVWFLAFRLLVAWFDNTIIRTVSTNR